MNADALGAALAYSAFIIGACITFAVVLLAFHVYDWLTGEST